jgi:hypothetical protein
MSEFLDLFPLMPFPDQDKRTLFSGDKTVTVRVSREVGKFKKGAVYRAISRETGKPWNILVGILGSKKTTVAGLPKFGVPSDVVVRIMKDGGVGPRAKAEMLTITTLRL